MEKMCNISRRIFTRKWNLQRHLNEVHNIRNETSKNRLNYEIDDYDYSLSSLNTSYNNNFQKEWYHINGCENRSKYINYNSKVETSI